MSYFEDWRTISKNITGELLPELKKKLRANFPRDEFTNERTILQIFSHKPTTQAVEAWLKETTKFAAKNVCHKSNDQASVLREQGNKCFFLGDYGKALQFYNKGIRYAVPRGISPSSDLSHQKADQSVPFIRASENEIALAYANRSAVFFKLQRYEKCLTDIDQALSLMYPEHLKPKLLKRKAECLFELDQFKDANSTLTQTRKLACKPGNKVELEKEIASAVDSLCEQIKNTTDLMPKNVPKIMATPEVPPEEQDPKFAHGDNGLLANASDGISIEQNFSVGRHLIADKSFKVGDTIIKEEPYVINTTSTTQCSYCLVQADQAVPCQKCVIASYCSTGCQKEAWDQYHSFECSHKFIVALQQLEMPSMALRILLKADVEELCNVRLKERTSIGKSKAGVHYGVIGERYQDGYEAIYNLTTKGISNEELLQAGLTASVLLLMMKKANYFERPEVQKREAKINEIFGKACQPLLEELFQDKAARKVTGMTEVFFGSLLLRHILQISCNQIPISGFYSSISSCVNLSEEMWIANGLFPTASLLNHSCDPNCTKSFLGNKIVVKTTKEVEPGEELSVSYGPLYTNERWDKRQDVLKRDYHFVCSCVRCKIGPVADSPYLAYKCQFCDGAILNLQPETCPSCEKPFQASWYESLNQQAKELFKITPTDADMLEESLRIQEKIFHRHNCQLSISYKKIAGWMVMQGKYAEGRCYFEKSLKISEAIYDEHSVELGFDLTSYADLLVEYTKQNMEASYLLGCPPDFENAKNCLKVSQRAVKVLSRSTRNGAVILALEKAKKREALLEAILQCELSASCC